jgi:hypothetical protein
VYNVHPAPSVLDFLPVAIGFSAMGSFVVARSVEFAQMIWLIVGGSAFWVAVFYILHKALLGPLEVIGSDGSVLQDDSQEVEGRADRRV